jgi:5'-nucleotidase
VRVWSPSETVVQVESTRDRKVLYIDMDNVLVDFPSGIARLDVATRTRYEGNFDEVPGIFSLMDPLPGAVEAFGELSARFDTYILSTAPWLNPSAWSDKVAWVHRHLGADSDSPAYKRLILSHHKHLNTGDFLVDDRVHNGADRFTGELVRFGSAAFPDWPTVVAYLRSRC